MDVAMLILTIISTIVACASLVLSIFIKKDVRTSKDVKAKAKQKVVGNGNKTTGNEITVK